MHIGILKLATHVCVCILYCGASQVAVVVKNLPACAGDIRDVGSVPGMARFPGGGKGYSLQYSCLENPTDRGVWWATVHGVTKSRTQISDKHTHTIKETHKLLYIQNVKQYCSKFYNTKW